MRHLTEFPTEQEAGALSDSLEVAGIEVEIRTGKAFSVWVIEDDQMEAANALLEAYKPDPAHAAAADKLRKQRTAKAKPKAMVKTNGSGAGASAGPLTLLMLVASVLVGLASGLGDIDSEIIRALLVEPIFEKDGMLQSRVALSWDEPWRLLTPMFIHFGIFHLVFNMMWLHRFGSQIESAHGTLRLLLLVVFAMVPAAILQFKLSGPLFGGMSGVNYALFGFVWMQARYGRRGYDITPRDTVLLMGWLLLCTTGLVGPVANASHAVGLAVGILAGMPVFLRFRNNHNTSVSFDKGSWADLNVTGWRRFERVYVQPYVPLWFMAIALGVLLLDW